MNERIDIEILECKSPTSFVAQAICADELKTFLSAERTWNGELESREGTAIINYQPHVHEVCAVKCREEKWQRIKVETLFHSARGEQANCFFMDSGKRQAIPLFRLRQLPEQFLSVPCQVRTLRLWGVRPLSMQMELSDTGYDVPYRPSKKWDASAISLFQELVNKSHGAQAEVMHQDVEGTMYVRLHLLLPNGWLCVNDKLVEEKYAMQKTLPDTGTDSDSSRSSGHPLDAGDTRTSLRQPPSPGSTSAGTLALSQNILASIVAASFEDPMMTNEEVMSEEELNHVLAKINRISNFPGGYQSDTEARRFTGQKSSGLRSELSTKRPASAGERGVERQSLILQRDLANFKTGQATVGAGIVDRAKRDTKQSGGVESLLKIKWSPQNSTDLNSRHKSINSASSCLTNVSIPALEPFPKEEKSSLFINTGVSANTGKLVEDSGMQTSLLVGPASGKSGAWVSNCGVRTSLISSNVATSVTDASGDLDSGHTLTHTPSTSIPASTISMLSTTSGLGLKEPSLASTFTWSSLPSGVFPYSPGGRGRAMRKLLSSDILKDIQLTTTPGSLITVANRHVNPLVQSATGTVNSTSGCMHKGVNRETSVMTNTDVPTSSGGVTVSETVNNPARGATCSQTCDTTIQSDFISATHSVSQQISNIRSNVSVQKLDPCDKSGSSQEAGKGAQGEDSIKGATQTVDDFGGGESSRLLGKQQLENGSRFQDSHQSSSEEEEDSLLISKTKLRGRQEGRKLLDSMGGGGERGVNSGSQLPRVWRSDRSTPTPFLGTLAWGALMPDPQYTIESIPFVDFIRESLLNEITAPRAIQAYSWPAILRGRHVIGIAPPGHGKTMAYLPALLSQLTQTDYLSLPTGSGPKALVLVPSWKKAHDIGDYINYFLGHHTTLRTIVIYAGGREETQVIPLLDGCDLLVATPHCLLRMIDRMYTNLKRLCHLILDDAEVLVEQFTPQIQQVMTLYAGCLEQSRQTPVPRQILVFTTAWTQGIASFQSQYQVDPVLVSASRLEASVYGGVQQVVHLCLKAQSRLVELLNQLTTGPDHRHIIIAAERDEHVLEIAQLLASQTIYAHVVDSTLGPNSEDVEDKVKQWRLQTGSTAVLVVTDNMIIELRVTCAHIVIHYNLPKSKTTFGNRLICMQDFFQDDIGRTTTDTDIRPVSHIIVSAEGLDGDRLEQIRSLRDFLARSGAIIPEGLSALLKGMHEGLNENETKKLCGYIKAFGICVNETQCPNRHLVLPVDSVKDCGTETWPPDTGEVKIRVNHVLSANHCHVRILEHRLVGHPPRDFRGVFTKMMMEMSQFLLKPANQCPYALEQGQRYLAAVRDKDGAFHRARVLTTLSSRLKNKATKVKVQYVDEGPTDMVDMEQLLKLPPHLQQVPPQAVEVYVCRIKPVDGDTDWTQRSDDFVKEQISNKELMGTVVLRMRNTLWLDPLSQQTTLPTLKTQVVTMILRNELLKRGMANDNPDHIKNLYQLCKGKINIPPNLLQKYLSLPVSQNIETEVLCPEEEYHEVYVSVVNTPYHLFVQTRDRELELEAMVTELDQHMEKIVKAKCGSASSSPQKPGATTPARSPAKGPNSQARVTTNSLQAGLSTPWRPGGDAENPATAPPQRLDTSSDQTGEATNLGSAAGGAVPKQSSGGSSPLKTGSICSSPRTSSLGQRRQQGYVSEDGVEDFVPEADRVCAAKFLEDGKWYRGRLMEWTQSGWRVFFLDYGECEVVTEDNIHRLPDQFCELPAQAIECSLDSVMPTGEEWSQESADALLDLCRYVTDEKKVMLAKVKDRGEAELAGQQKCVIDLFDTNLPSRDLHVNQELVWLGLANREDDDLTDLYPKVTFSTRKLYPSLGDKIYDICSALFWTQNEDKAKPLAKLASDSLLAELQLGNEMLFEWGALLAVVNLIGYVRSCDAQDTLLSAVVKCVEMKPSVCMAAAGELLMMRLVFCMEQARLPAVQVQAATSAVQLARVEGFREALDREEIVSMFCYVLEVDPLPQMLHLACCFLTLVLYHGHVCAVVCKKMKMCEKALQLLREVHDTDAQELILALLAAAATHDRLHPPLLREAAITDIVTALEKASSQQSVFHSASICQSLCQASRRNKKLLLEAKLAIIVQDFLAAGLQSPAKEVCEELIASLAVRAPQQELAGVHVTRQDPSAAPQQMVFPRVKWSQNTFRAVVNVSLRGARESDFTITDTKVHCRSEADGQLHGFDLTLFGHLETERCKVKVGPSQVVLSLRKLEKGMWSRLTRDKIRFPHLKPDLDNLYDSGSESEVEDDDNPMVLAKRRVVRLPKYEPGPEPVQRFSYSEDSEDSEDAIASYSDEERFAQDNDIDYRAFMDSVLEKQADEAT